MKITNKTSWSTADLRRVFAEGLRLWNSNGDRKVPNKGLNVRVTHRKNRVRNGWGRHTTGYAWIRGRTILIHVPRADEVDALDPRDVAFVFEHEAAHCAGFEHSQMGALNHRAPMIKTGRYDKLAGFNIRKQTP